MAMVASLSLLSLPSIPLCLATRRFVPPLRLKPRTLLFTSKPRPPPTFAAMDNTDAFLEKSGESYRVTEVLHMAKGDGEGSYAKNSTYTQRIAALIKPTLVRSIESIFEEANFPRKQLLNVADLGCSAGPNTFTFISNVIQGVSRVCEESEFDVPELQFYLNDLVHNDFNTLFESQSRSIANDAGLPCFVLGVPGSFYERLFPRNCLHLVHSIYSVHWLSKVPQLMGEGGLPLNKGKIYISKTSSPAVKEAYLAQFQNDFTRLLKCRSEEMMVGARMVLAIQGRQDSDPGDGDSSYIWEMLGKAIASLVEEGNVDEYKLDNLNIPLYSASEGEIRGLVSREGSFSVVSIEKFELERGVAELKPEEEAHVPEEDRPWIRGLKTAKSWRSFTGSIIQHHLGEEILDKLYNDKLPHVIAEDLSSNEPTKNTTILIVLRKKLPYI